MGNPLAATVLDDNTLTVVQPTITGIIPDTGIPGDFITSNNGLFSLKGTDQAFGTVEIFLDSGSGFVSQGTAGAGSGAGNWSFALVLADGIYTVQVKDVGTGGLSATQSLTIDTAAPAAPVVALTQDTGSSPTDKITYVGTLSVITEPAATVEYSINGGGTWSPELYAGRGANSVQVRQRDQAGNASPGTTFSFTLDTVDPTVVASRTGQPYADAHSGWNNTDVTVSFVASDVGGSGVTNPADEVFNTDGSFTSTAKTVTDVAGNTSAASNTFAIKIDKTAPTVTASRTGQPYADAHSGWNNTDVTVSFVAGDVGGSGGVSNPADEVFSTDGSFTSTAKTVTDVAGNTSAASNTFAIKIDKTAPTVVASRTGQAYADAHSGWNNTDVTVSFVASDAGSGVTNPTDSVFSTDGTFTSAAKMVTDMAGNTSAPSNTFVVKIDKTVPTVTASRTGQPYADAHSGWNNTDVTVSFVASDAGSGVSNPADEVFSTDGSFTSTAKTVTDVAGNTSAASNTFAIKIDKTVPTVTASRTGQPYADAHSGWNNTDVTVSFVASDAGSGVSNPADEVFSTDGSFTSTAKTVTDVAGNTSAASNTFAIKIDKTVPTVTASRTGQPYADAHSGWNNTDVTVSFVASDAGSGVSNPADEVFSTDGSFTSTATTVTDVAGNTSAASNTFAIKIDKTAPTVTASRTGQPYADAHSGWNNTDVTVSFVASDAGSGVSNPADEVFSTDGSFTSTATTVTDVAGNTSAASNTFEIKIDKTVPTVTASRTGQPYADAHSGWNNTDVTVSFVASDAGSGVSNPADEVFSTDGSFTSTATTVTDVAGNTSAASNTFEIKIDKTAPTLAFGAPSGTLGTNGWYISDVLDPLHHGGQPFRRGEQRPGQPGRAEHGRAGCAWHRDGDRRSR